MKRVNLSRRFVIPDIHGCALTLDRLLREVIQLKRSDELYLLGDYIDRGPRSREVLDILMGLTMKGYRVFPLRGNHEEMFLKSLVDPEIFRLWLINGGDTTLESFGVEDPRDIPITYRTFMEKMPYYRILPDFVLVHGGINFSIADPFSDTETMLWSRSTEVRRELIGGRRVIGGHTPMSRDDILQRLANDRIALDNGCVYAQRPGMGNLAALELNTMTLYFQENID